MTEIDYPSSDMVRGRKPSDPVTEKPLRPYATRLPEDVIRYLRALPNAAAWLTAMIRRRMRPSPTPRPRKRK